MFLNLVNLAAHVYRTNSQSVKVALRDVSQFGKVGYPSFRTNSQSVKVALRDVSQFGKFGYPSLQDK